MLTKFLMAKAEMFEIDGQVTANCILSLNSVLTGIRNFHLSEPETFAVKSLGCKAGSFLGEILKIGKA
jgi:hypothetical protein